MYKGIWIKLFAGKVITDDSIFLFQLATKFYWTKISQKILNAWNPPPTWMYERLYASQKQTGRFIKFWIFLIQKEVIFCNQTPFHEESSYKNKIDSPLMCNRFFCCIPNKNRHLWNASSLLLWKIVDFYKIVVKQVSFAWWLLVEWTEKHISLNYVF